MSARRRRTQRERDKSEAGERETVEDAGRENRREREVEREASGRATSYRMSPHVAACRCMLPLPHVAACRPHDLRDERQSEEKQTRCALNY